VFPPKCPLVVKLPGTVWRYGEITARTRPHCTTGLESVAVVAQAKYTDSRQFETLLEIGPDITPRAVITDKGYDSKANREAARRRGSLPVIPHRSNAKRRPAFFQEKLYKLRARIEQMIGKAKRFKRLACAAKKRLSYASIVALVCVFILIKSVHTT
jgi:IS5 family transposase